METNVWIRVGWRGNMWLSLSRVIVAIKQNRVLKSIPLQSNGRVHYISYSYLCIQRERIIKVS